MTRTKYNFIRRFYSRKTINTYDEFIKWNNPKNNAYHAYPIQYMRLPNKNTNHIIFYNFFMKCTQTG